jgi:outer membrane lipoprotein-sorting protein
MKLSARLLLTITPFCFTPAVWADAKADALLQQLAAKTKATPRLSAELVLRDKASDSTRTWIGPLNLQRPNMARVQLTYTVSPSAGSYIWSFISDGKTVWSWETSTNPRNLRTEGRVRTWPADPQGADIDPMAGAIAIPFFFSQSLDGLFPKNPRPTSRYVGQEAVEGNTYEVIEVTGGQTNPLTIRLYIGPDKLLHRSQMIVKLDEGEHTYEAVLQNIDTTKRLTAETFRFTLPEGMTLQRVRTHQERKDALLALNASAPPFSLPVAGGGTLTLSDALKKQKAVLLNFWFYH